MVPGGPGHIVTTGPGFVKETKAYTDRKGRFCSKVDNNGNSWSKIKKK